MTSQAFRRGIIEIHCPKMCTKFTCDIGGTLISQHKSAPELDAKLVSCEIPEFCNRNSRLFAKKMPTYQGNSTISKKERHENACWSKSSNVRSVNYQGISGVDWRFYKSPRPGPVFDVYMKYLGDVEHAGWDVWGHRVQVTTAKVHVVLSEQSQPIHKWRNSPLAL